MNLQILHTCLRLKNISRRRWFAGGKKNTHVYYASELLIFGRAFHTPRLVCRKFQRREGYKGGSKKKIMDWLWTNVYGLGRIFFSLVSLYPRLLFLFFRVVWCYSKHLAQLAGNYRTENPLSLSTSLYTYQRSILLKSYVHGDNYL